MNYQIKLTNNSYPSFVHLKLYDTNNKEIYSTKTFVRYGIIHKINYPRVRYSSKEFYNLQKRIDQKYPQSRN